MMMLSALALPWVLSILILDDNGNLHEKDIARFNSKSQCVASLDGTQWARLREPFDGQNIIQRKCTKVHYEP